MVGVVRRERETVCVIAPSPPSVYLVLRANDQVRRFVNIHYIIWGLEI